VECRLVRILPALLRKLIEVLHDARAVMRGDHLADHRRKVVTLREREPVADVGGDDAGGHQRIELVVRVRAGLVLDEAGGVSHLADVVVVRADTRDKRIGPDNFSRTLGKVRNEKRVVIRARRPQQELSEERMIRIRELAQLEHGRDPEEVPEDRGAREGEQARARTAHESGGGELRRANGSVADRPARTRQRHRGFRSTLSPRRPRTRARSWRRYRGHTEQRGHEHVGNELDLPGQDADMERAGDLRSEGGATADEHGDDHRDRRERDEVHEQRVARMSTRAAIVTASSDSATTIILRSSFHASVA
jgi:hypothetical protein